MIIEWLANILLVAGMYLIGKKYRPAFLLTGVGEIVWVGTSLYQRNWPLAFICAMFAVLQFLSFYRWKPQTQLNTLYAAVRALLPHPKVGDYGLPGTMMVADLADGRTSLEIFLGSGAVAFYFDSEGRYVGKRA